MKRIILASNSPRRRELLSGLDVDFTVDSGNTFEEKIDPAIPHRNIPMAMAMGKSNGFHRPLEDDELLITADTMVLIDGVMLGKPHSREEAVNMLRELSGRRHEVITAVVLRDNSRTDAFEDSTMVDFAELTDDEIDYYIDTCKPFDKAGSYGVQEWIGYIGITGIVGSFYNVMGFPLQKVYAHLKYFK